VARRRRPIRRWERREPAKRKRRRVERIILGAGMGMVAGVLERRIVKSLKKKGVTEADLRTDKTEGFQALNVEPSKD
jgi:hypothetical protein